MADKKKKQIPSHAVDFSRFLAELVTLQMSLGQRYSRLLAKIPESAWASAVTQSASWFEFYSLTPDQAYAQLTQGFTAEGAPDLEELSKMAVEEIESKFKSAFKQVRNEIKEMVAEAKGVMAAIGTQRLERMGKIPDKFIEELRIFRTTSAEINARCTYGQSMSALIKAGRHGNDVGYLRAVTIDPTVQWHPAVRRRVAREALTGKGAFATSLLNAAKEGPSKRIDKDLNQLRFVLGLLHDLKVLKRMSNALRYEVFCESLGLYPDRGGNAKPGLWTFIKRWERGLL
jgi:hypothetical protein